MITRGDYHSWDYNRSIASKDVYTYLYNKEMLEKDLHHCNPTGRFIPRLLYERLRTKVQQRYSNKFKLLVKNEPDIGFSWSQKTPSDFNFYFKFDRGPLLNRNRLSTDFCLNHLPVIGSSVMRVEVNFRRKTANFYYKRIEYTPTELTHHFREHPHVSGTRCCLGETPIYRIVHTASIQEITIPLLRFWKYLLQKDFVGLESGGPYRHLSDFKHEFLNSLKNNGAVSAYVTANYTALKAALLIQIDNHKNVFIANINSTYIDDIVDTIDTMKMEYDQKTMYTSNLTKVFFKNKYITRKIIPNYVYYKQWIIEYLGSVIYKSYERQLYARQLRSRHMQSANNRASLHQNISNLHDAVQGRVERNAILQESGE